MGRGAGGTRGLGLRLRRPPLTCAPHLGRAPGRAPAPGASMKDRLEQLKAVSPAAGLPRSQIRVRTGRHPPGPGPGPALVRPALGDSPPSSDGSDALASRPLDGVCPRLARRAHPGPGVPAPCLFRCWDPGPGRLRPPSLGRSCPGPRGWIVVPCPTPGTAVAGAEGPRQVARGPAVPKREPSVTLLSLVSDLEVEVTRP